MTPKTRIDLRELAAFLFDLDGVITRTAEVHAAAWKRLFDDFLARRARAEGTVFVPFDPVADYEQYVDGRPREEGVRSFLEARGLSLPTGSPDDAAEAETVNGLSKRKDAYFLEALLRDGVKVCDGAPEFVRVARNRGIAVAVVSSSQNCAAVLQAARLPDLFDARVDGVDLKRLRLRGKPAPDMYLEAAGRIGVAPAHAAVFEDALVGVEAGRAGGFKLVVGVGRGAHAAALRARGADTVVSRLDVLSLENDSLIS